MQYGFTCAVTHVKVLVVMGYWKVFDVLSNASHWHFLEVKACVKKGTILFQKESLVFVVLQLTGVKLHFLF